MNYITSCPACETQFLLTKAHLKAHRGKVQCGHCEHIFNAKNRLTEISDDIQSPAEYQASLEADTIEPNYTVEEKPINEMLNGVLDSVPNLVNLESEEFEFPEKTNNPFIGDFLPEVTEHIDINALDSPIVIDDLTTDPKFHKKKFKLNFGALMLCLLLAILVALQSIYFYRSKIAAENPQFKPYLVQACVTLKCEINLPKNLDLFTIDDSDMQESEQYENVINFSSLLINNANYTQAYPNIELTLTSTDDQPVLRRIVKPSEYLKTSTNMANGLASHEEERINLAINVTDLAVAGYRVLLVY
jgi:predicted Zn finger-like uncharacterized protein